MPNAFEETFVRLAGGRAPLAPRAWQARLAEDDRPGNRLIRIPTGFGKTLGVFAAWYWHRVQRKDERWPRRLIWCLPMRVLTEQTADEVRDALERVGSLWDGHGGHDGRVGVHVLMGGEQPEPWHLHPEHCAVLVGTQDMLLSRALNRGFASSRARWPVEFGLLNHDALWVLDEVQLMDIGLATSAQLQAFMESDGSRGFRPRYSWWMSATLQPEWLKSVDSASTVDAAAATCIPPEARTGALWADVHKPLEVMKSPSDAKPVIDGWERAGKGKLTLVVVNRVDTARKLHTALSKSFQKRGDAPDLRLVHSRFRPAERASWRDEFLSRDSRIPPEGRIIVATQVVEAGVDVDASLLFTELAPWPSLVQRFGRAARRGGTAAVTVFAPPMPDDAKKADQVAAPYAAQDLRAAREALSKLADVSPSTLERFQDEASPADLRRLFRYEPRVLLLAREWRELFDTTPDLTGADLDISRFIRSGEERDVSIWWGSVAPGADPDPLAMPSRDALCAVPFLETQKWLCGPKGERLTEGRRAWVRDWFSGRFRLAARRDLLPGRVVLVAAECGGYVIEHGFDPSSKARVPPVHEAPPARFDEADAAQDTEALSEIDQWRTIGTHGLEVAAEVRSLALALGLDASLTKLLELAGRWHDHGKGHPAFQGSIRGAGRPLREDLAKAPPSFWPKGALYRTSDGRDHRPGFRHELASALALFALVARQGPRHALLASEWAEMLSENAKLPCAEAVRSMTERPASALERAVLALERDEFGLLAYLVASHHGKVRASLHATPQDQEYVARDGRGLPIRGVREGDRIPPITLPEGESVPGLTLNLDLAFAGLSPLTGASWSERVMALVERIGPAALAWLEAILRCADVRASQTLTTRDAMLLDEVLP